MVSEACIDWSGRVADCHVEFFEAPKDVTIKTVDGEVKGHRLILAMASPALAKSMEKDASSASIILQKEATTATVETMVNFIYNSKSVKLQGMSSRKLLQVLSFAGKWHIPELLLAVLDTLTVYDLTKEVLLNTAADIIRSSADHGLDAKQLLLLCAKFLKPKLPTFMSVLLFMKHNKNQQAVFFQLQVLMREKDILEIQTLPYIKWSTRVALLLAQTDSILTDVTFEIEGKIVRAHKLILAMASPVFMKMFFTSEFADKKAQEIPVKETTHEAFEVMVEAIYNTTSMQKTPLMKSAGDIFDVLNLAVKYEIPKMEITAKACLAAFPVTKDTLLTVASDAQAFLVPFREEATEVLARCAGLCWTLFSRPRDKGPGPWDHDSLFQYCCDHEEQQEVLCLLQGIMVTTPCKDCNKVPCEKVGPRPVYYWSSDSD